ncbi:MAG: hypothetical protein GY918_10535 [Gammaproteobacteria bacterium]|nr:hypothetical protein [Gammaproteobacteria bacterium]
MSRTLKSNSLTSGLVGCWVFDEGAPIKNIVSDITATVNGTPTLTAGSPGYATFASNDSYESSEAAVEDLTTLTYVAGIRATPATGAFRHICGVRNGGSYMGQLRLTAGAEVSYLATSGSTTGSALTPASDYTVAVNHTTGNAPTLWVDGALDTTGTTKTLSDIAVPFTIGCQADGSLPMTERVRYVYVWNRELSSGEHAEIHADPDTIFTSDTTPPDLSLPTSTAVTQTTATVGCTTANDTDGELYVVATATTDKPSAANVKLGNDYLGATATVGAQQTITSAGAKTFDIGGTLVPGATLYMHYMHEDAAANQSTVLTDSTGITMLDAFTTTAVYSGPAEDIPVKSILHYLNALAASGSAVTAVVTAAGWTVNEHANLTLVKDADGSEGVVSSNTADTLTYVGAADMTGGGLFDIVATIDTSDEMYCEYLVSVVYNAIDDWYEVEIDWYSKDVSEGTHSPVYTQIVTDLSVAEAGYFTTSLAADGVLTLTPLPVITGGRLINGGLVS